MRKSRLVFTIMLTLVEEVALALFVIFGLPRLGVKVPLGGLIAMMSGLVAYGIVSYRMGSRALLKEPMAGFTDMVGSRGKVVKPLNPGGVIKIAGELWEATTIDCKIDTGEEVVVIGREGLKLIVDGKPLDPDTLADQSG